MSSLLAQLTQARQAKAAAEKLLQELEANPELQKIQTFEKNLRALMGQFGMSLVDINGLLDPNYKPPKAKPADKPEGAKPATKGKINEKTGKQRKTRTTRTYTNPHTGEKLVYVGGVNKVLEEWKVKWGADSVKGWGILDK